MPAFGVGDWLVVRVKDGANPSVIRPFISPIYIEATPPPPTIEISFTFVVTPATVPKVDPPSTDAKISPLALFVAPVEATDTELGVVAVAVADTARCPEVSTESA